MPTGIQRLVASPAVRSGYTSAVVHMLALIGLALLWSDGREPPRPRPIVIAISAAPEAEEEFESFEAETPLDTPLDTPVETTDLGADVTVTSNIVVENTAVSDAAEAAAALPVEPLAVAFTEFDAIAAPDSNTLSPVGPIGGGFTGRKNAAALAGKRGGGKDTEDAVDRALRWFIDHQMPDGGWSFNLQLCPSCQGKCSHGSAYANGHYVADRCAATGLALLPFLGRGYTHKEGPYRKQIEAGIGFLAGLAIQSKGNVAVAAGGGPYSQGIAGICLSEAYAMTRDSRLQAPTQCVLDCIAAWQDPVGGGWGYMPQIPGDTSILGWKLMALKSGNMAYLSVNSATIKNAARFLDAVAQDGGSSYSYSVGIRAPENQSSMTAVGLLCRMYLGCKKDNPALQRGVARLAQKGPTNDLYYSYYATQIMHHMEGDVWQAWNEQMKKMLLATQATKGHEAGSWFTGVDGCDPNLNIRPPVVGGRLYCTSLATMMLEVYYRHLPIYRNQVTDEEFLE